MVNQCMWGSMHRRNTSKVSWVLSFLYMTGDKTRAGTPYTPRMWKDEKTLKFMYCGKGLGGKGASVSKEESDETQELHKNCLGGMSLSHRLTLAWAQLIPPVSQANGESSVLHVSFWASQVINSLLGPWGGINFALWFDCREQRRPNFRPLPVAGDGVSCLGWRLAHVVLHPKGCPSGRETEGWDVTTKCCRTS